MQSFLMKTEQIFHLLISSSHKFFKQSLAVSWNYFSIKFLPNLLFSIIAKIKTFCIPPPSIFIRISGFVGMRIVKVLRLLIKFSKLHSGWLSSDTNKDHADYLHSQFPILSLIGPILFFQNQVCFQIFLFLLELIYSPQLNLLNVGQKYSLLFLNMSEHPVVVLSSSTLGLEDTARPSNSKVFLSHF